MDLDRIPLWSDRHDISVEKLWSSYCQFPYLPRLASVAVLTAAISDGVAKIDWATETFAYADAHDGVRWVGLRKGQHVEARPSGLVVAPDAATRQADMEQPRPGTGGATGGGGGGSTVSGNDDDPPPPPTGPTLPTRYYGRFDLDRVRAIRQLEDLLANVVDHLAGAPGAELEITVEVNARSEGYDDRIRRVVTENATNLGAKAQDFE